MHVSKRERPTLGLEEELFVVSRDTSMPVPIPVRCREEFAQRIGTRYSGEYKASVLELITRLRHHDPRQLIDEASANRCSADAILARYGLRTLALASHPTAIAFDLRPREHELSAADNRRYRRIESFKGDAVHNLAVNGVHLHVGTYDSPERHAALPTLMHLAPLHTALTACSPFFNGRDTGQESWRLRVLMTMSSTLPVMDGTEQDLEVLERLLAEAGGPADASEHWGLVRRGAGKPTIEFRAADTAPDLDVLIALSGLTACAAHAVRNGWLPELKASQSRSISVYQFNLEAVAAKGTGAKLIDIFDLRVKSVSDYAASWVTRCERAIDDLDLGDAISGLSGSVGFVNPGRQLRMLMADTAVDGIAHRRVRVSENGSGLQRAVEWAWRQAEMSPSKPWTSRLRAAA
jgi:gamma-glutamyl:cysteine ligase YbdK (ATP-grasp superfamily)